MSRRSLLAIFLLGLALSLLLVFRCQPGADQINLLARGWLLAAKGRFVPYGNPTSAGGFEAGGVSTVLVALPLYLWRDYRAPILFIVLLQALGYLLLDRLLRDAGAGGERMWFAVLYWLSPWRLYYSGFLWNPNYLFFAGAVHAITLWAQRDRARFWPSLAHALTIGVAMQLHPSAVWLPAATGLLWLRRYARLHWGGVATGVTLCALSLLPWVLAVQRDPSLLPGGKGFPGRGLVFFFPFLRGLLYWLRYGSFWLSGKAFRFDFSEVLGPAARGVLEPLLRSFAVLVVIPSFGFALVANVKLWGRRREASSGARDWLAGYARLGFVAAAIVFAAAPTTVMSWQGLILFHAAVLPLVLVPARSRRALVLGWGAASVLLALGMAFGSPRYHCEVRTFEVPALRHDHPMLHELGIHDRCPVVTGDPEGWWTDLLPPE